MLHCAGYAGTWTVCPAVTRGLLPYESGVFTLVIGGLVVAVIAAFLLTGTMLFWALVRD